jgi:murein DD-endopeptidase MepM/ murein hydrolase activator NlpD
MRLPTLLVACIPLMSLAVDIQLPTENRNLLSGNSEKFYMYVDRFFEGAHSQPWEAGGYGFVRTSVRVGNQILQTKFHEGIDISPVNRDKAGNPLDHITSIAAGKIAYVCDVAGRSNYGKYVVVEHVWEDSPVYSLYAHLADVSCKAGDQVTKGGVLGRMGFTGDGITRERAHCHLELALMLHSRFDDSVGKTLGYHGAFNGVNLAGLDVASFFLAHKKNPAITVSQFLSNFPVYFKATIPNEGPLDLATRCPWMLRSNEAKPSLSWEISFSETGMPLAITASDRKVLQPTITMVRPSDVPHGYKTRGLLKGDGNTASFSPAGMKLINHISGKFPAATIPANVPVDKKKP